NGRRAVENQFVPKTPLDAFAARCFTPIMPKALALFAALALVSFRAAADDVLAGHSTHGEAVNEGPRQAAVFMGGTGQVHLPVTTTSAAAQKFFDQGVGQLYGFWFFEAER